MPGAARQGDKGPHCSPWVVATASSNVFINGRGAARVGDRNSPHLRPAGKRCRLHTAAVATGSGSVFINGRPAAWLGSSMAGCTKIATCSNNVFYGR